MFYKIKSCVEIGMDTLASFALSLWQEAMKKSCIREKFQINLDFPLICIIFVTKI